MFALFRNTLVRSYVADSCFLDIVAERHFDAASLVQAALFREHEGQERGTELVRSNSFWRSDSVNYPPGPLKAFRLVHCFDTLQHWNGWY